MIIRVDDFSCVPGFWFFSNAVSLSITLAFDAPQISSFFALCTSKFRTCRFFQPTISFFSGLFESDRIPIRFVRFKAGVHVNLSEILRSLRKG